MSESPLGEANSSTKDRDKNVCPKCGKQCSSRRGVSMHALRSHDLTIPQYPILTDKDWLQEKYWGEMKTAAQIADEIGCGNATVSRYLNEHDIDRRAGGNWGNVLDGGLSEEATDVIEGELLGDGSIRMRGGKSCTSPFRYGTSSEEYRDWLAAYLESVGFDLRKRTEMTTLDGYGSYEQYWLSTLQYRCLYKIGERWYSDKGKRVPDDLKLSPIKLRHWFIGDGSGGENLTLHTEGFTNTCRDRLIQQLSTKGIRATAQGAGELLIWEESRKRFFEFMAPLPPELESVYGYKWD